MTTYFTSDLHFGHDREFIYGPRGFPNIEEHDEAIIQRWNDLVKPEDEVYVLGDLMLKDNKHGIECLNRLNGYKFVILGNHDTSARVLEYRALKNTSIIGYAGLIKLDGYRFYLSHYPTLTANLSDDINGLKAGILNLFGHTHQRTNFYNDIPMMYHIGVDSHDCVPVSAAQVINDIKAKAKECLDML